VREGRGIRGRDEGEESERKEDWKVDPTNGPGNRNSLT